MNPTIKIPVNPAVKKYLEIKLGKNYTLGTDDWFGIIVYNFLINKTNKHFKIIPKKYDKEIQFFEIILSSNQAEKAGIILTEKQEASINNICYKIFKEELYSAAVVNKNLYSLDYMVTMNNLLDLYDITEEDLSYDALIKGFYRDRKAISENMYL
ncbi:hypothetical protein [Chryseobacterium terrae]|uniref:Uncharacterized protein n=1 Tax=Chryseobacterium terrae TaxID=3163299 RepID=A0ABW8Y6U7_9FLAO